MNDKPLPSPISPPLCLNDFHATEVGGSEAELKDSLNALLRRGDLTLDEAKARMRNYIGTRHTLIVRESALLSGVPPNLPPDAPVWAGPRFAYHGYLNIYGERLASGKLRHNDEDDILSEIQNAPQLE